MILLITASSGVRFIMRTIGEVMAKLLVGVLDCDYQKFLWPIMEIRAAALET